MPSSRKSFAEAAVRERTGREVPDLLRELYVERRHSQQEIADALEELGVGVSRVLISQWLSKYGITREERPAVAL